jgi:hypothetical protein
MNKREYTPANKEQLESCLEEVRKSVLACFDEGLDDVAVVFHRSAVEVTKLDDMHRKYEAGPTAQVLIAMHNPKDDRPEEWH